MTNNRCRNHGDAAAARVDDIFFCMLRRKAGLRGLRYFQWLCGNRIGANIAVFLLALTPASRVYGKTWQRIKNALLHVNGLVDESGLPASNRNHHRKKLDNARKKIGTDGDQGFNLVGYISAELGIGEGARAMADAALAADIPYSVIDVGFQTAHRQMDRRALPQATDRHFDVDVVYVNADHTPATLFYLDMLDRPDTAYRIGYWHWEQTKLPEAFMNGFDGLDEIWVPTAFVQEAVSNASPIPVVRVPHAIAFDVDATWSRRTFGIPENRFAVLVMYDFHSYRYRKNPEAAIAAFKQAALPRKDMCLVIKTINAEKYPQEYAALKQDVADLECVVLLENTLTREQVYALEACCDCLLSLHRAEGFGLSIAEMMYLGKPVIATGWSGNMEYMTPMNSFPVNYELKPLAKPLGVYAAGLDWAEPDVEHAAKCLRTVVEDTALAQAIGGRAEQAMRSRFSPAAIGQRYKERFAVIRSML